MKNNFIKIFALSIGMLVLPVSPVLAIGQMTQPIVVENAIRGQEILETLTLYSSESEDKEFGLIAEGQIEGWAKFYSVEDENFENPTNKILIPAKSDINAVVIFIVPEDTPNGTYEGIVYLTSAPPKADESEGSSVSVMQRVGREVLITVTDQEIVDFNVSVIPVSYDVDRNEPLKIRFIYYNQGNIKIAPQVQIKIKTFENEVKYNAIFPYPDGTAEVKPGARLEIPEISVPTTGLENGKYRVELEISAGEVVKQESFRFSVGRTGRILGAMFSAFGSGTWQKVGLIILVVLAVGLGMAISNYRTNPPSLRGPSELRRASRIYRTDRSNPSARLGGFAKTGKRRPAGFWGKLKEGKSWISGLFG